MTKEPISKSEGVKRNRKSVAANSVDPHATTGVSARPRQSSRRRIVPFIILVLLFTLVGALWLTAGTRTEPFRSASGKIIPGSIAQMSWLSINGVKERVWYRGISEDNPVLILLHGGPGASESPLFRYYDAQLERHFLVVYWDQRGAGRSYHLLHPPQNLAVPQFVADLHTLVLDVRHRFQVRKVALLAHSWGTVIGTIYASRYPSDLSAYVGIGQVANEPEDELVGYDWALRQARIRGNVRAVKELTRIGPPPHSEGEMQVERKWVARFGGSFYGDRMNEGDLIRAALRTSELSWVDLIYFGFGIHYSMEHIWPHFRTVDLERYRSFKVPVFFLEGRHDWQVPAVVAKQYYSEVHAPYKKLIWFEHSAHNVPFEQPRKFIEVMVHDVLPVIRQSLGTSQPRKKVR